MSNRGNRDWDCVVGAYTTGCDTDTFATIGPTQQSVSGGVVTLGITQQTAFGGSSTFGIPSTLEGEKFVMLLGLHRLCCMLPWPLLPCSLPLLFLSII
jgi:hypothetical protein